MADYEDTTCQLLETLRHPDPHVRRHAIRSLAKTRDPRGTPALLAALDAPEPSVRAAAAAALGQLGARQAKWRLLELLGEGDVEVCLAAAEALGEIADPDAVPGLSLALRNARDPALRISAEQALSKIGGPSALAALQTAARDDTPGEGSGDGVSDMRNWPVPASGWARLVYAVIMILVPIASFWLASHNGFPGALWQSGRADDYAIIMLGRAGSGIFYPLLAYAMLCMLLLLVSPRFFSRFFIIRLGIYTGVVLALQYAILLRISEHGSPFYEIAAAGIILPFGIAWVYPKIAARFDEKRIWAVIICLIVCYVLAALIGLVLAALVFDPSYVFGMVPIPLFCVVILASEPFWCLALAVLVSFRLLRDYELPQKHHIGHFLGISAWLIAYILAWPVAITRTLEEYASLPTSPPGCYIATAAARGHPRIVRSVPLAVGSGQIVWLNDQVRTFKAAELALMTIFPGGHRILRALYDRVGSSLARLITHPLLADMVYISLKPIEWGFRATMRLFIPHIEDTVHRLYADLE